VTSLGNDAHPDTMPTRFVKPISRYFTWPRGARIRVRTTVSSVTATTASQRRKPLIVTLHQPSNVGTLSNTSYTAYSKNRRPKLSNVLGVAGVSSMPRARRKKFRRQSFAQGLELPAQCKVVSVQFFPLPPPSDFPPLQLRRNNEDVVIPFSLSCS